MKRQGDLLLANGLLMLSYLLLAQISGLPSTDGPQASLVRPEAGVALGWAYARGIVMLPGITLGALVANLLHSLHSAADYSATVGSGGTLALAVTLQAYLSSVWLRQSRKELLWFRRMEEYRLFYIIVVPITCLIVPLTGTAVQLVFGVATEKNIAMEFLDSWIGNVIGVYLVAPVLILALTEEPGLNRRRLARILLPTLILVLIATLGFLVNREMARSDSSQRIRNRTIIAGNRMRLSLEKHKEFLNGSQLLFRHRAVISQREFSEVADIVLSQHEGIKAVSWNPLILHGQKEDFIAEMRKQEGLNDFRISEMAADGTVMVSSRPRPSYVPVKYIEPRKANTAAIGFDIQSNDVRSDAIKRATSTNTIQATSPIKLVQSTQRQDSYGFLMLQPVWFRATGALGSPTRLKGFLVGVYEMDTLLESLFHGQEWNGYQFRLMEKPAATDPRGGAAAGGIRLLATYPEEAPGRTPAAGTAEGWNPHRKHQVPIEIGGQQWLLQVRDITAQLGSLPLMMSGFILQIGLLAACVMEGFLIWLTGSEQTTQRELERKLRTSLTTAAMAHEIKQPLTALLLQSRELQRLEQDVRNGGKGQLHHVSGQISENASRISRVIDNIRDILRNAVTNAEHLAINELVDQALLIAKSDALVKHIEIEVNQSDRSAMVSGDRAQLIMAIKNVLKNSIEAVDQGGRIRVFTRLRKNWVDILVCDDGPGFSEEVMRQNYYGLVSSKVGGSGLGLFLCSSAIENNRGLIRLGRSRMGGAEVTISLPREYTGYTVPWPLRGKGKNTI